MTIHITIERERNESDRFRARLRPAADAPVILISSSQYGSVSRARAAMEAFFARPIASREATERGLVRAAAEVVL